MVADFIAKVVQTERDRRGVATRQLLSGEAQDITGEELVI